MHAIASPTEVKGMVFDIQHASVVDGPGLRTTVFLKGCPLRCRWCHNPEAIRTQPEPLAHPHPNGGRPEGEPEMCGREMSVDEVIAEIAGEADYYRATGGGLTVSGGEPLVQAGFTTALLREARARSIHTCLDTSGFGSHEALEAVLPFTDLFLFDYKATGTALHQQLTGVAPERILENLQFLAAQSAALILRCPMIPGLNDSPEHFEAIAQLARTHPSIQAVHILPYHHWGKGKALPLWCPNWGLNQLSATAADHQRWQSLLRQTGCRHASIR